MYNRISRKRFLPCFFKCLNFYNARIQYKLYIFCIIVYHETIASEYDKYCYVSIAYDMMNIVIRILLTSKWTIVIVWMLSTSRKDIVMWILPMGMRNIVMWIFPTGKRNIIIVWIFSRSRKKIYCDVNMPRVEKNIYCDANMHMRLEISVCVCLDDLWSIIIMDISM